MATIYIDNEPYTVENEERNLLEVCLSLGFNLPYFCWHPAMHSVGACRQCAVKQFKDEKDTRGRIVMACMTPAKDGTRISVDDPEAVAFRKGVIEWLMVNHPHDCPVCDEGGECHLQDMTVMTGHVYRRMRFKKRTYRNQDLGPFVNHELNRCIQCYRCVRYYKELAGGHDLVVLGCHDHVYFGRYEDGVLESEFSGNLVEVCPTGVFTDKTQWRHYTRKWDLQTAPSICVHCGLGCNTIPGERYGTLRRIRNRYNGQVNGHFLCDRGRYGYEFVNSEQRFRRTALRSVGGQPQPTCNAMVMEHLAKILRKGKLIGIGSPKASLESNFALQTLVGEDRFFHGVSEQQYKLVRLMAELLRNGPSRSPSQQEVATADAVLILGEDLNNVAPMLAFAVRQSVMQAPREEVVKGMGLPAYDDNAVREGIQDKRGPLFILTPWETRLDNEATAVYRAAPDDIARLGYTIAHALAPGAPAVNGLTEEETALVERIAGMLKAAKRPVVVSGFSCGSEAIIRAAANTAWALGSELCFTMPECNSLGLSLMGGGDIQRAVELLKNGEVDTVIVLENDLYHQLDKGTADALFEHARHVIAVDCLMHETTRKAEVVLPAGTFAEADGTFVNSEGRAQRFFQVYVPGDDIKESWRWLGDLMPLTRLTEVNPWLSLDDIMVALAEAIPIFSVVPKVALGADFRILGMKVARQPHRYSGRTAMVADKTVFEPQPSYDPDSPLAFTMEGYQGRPPAPLIPRFWAPGWNSEQALHKFQSEVGGPLIGGDPGIRLIEPGEKARAAFIGKAPEPFTRREGEWLILPRYHVFGSELLSMYAQGVAALAPQPYLGIGAEDAKRLGVDDGQAVSVDIGGRHVTLPVRIIALPAGVAALPVGLPTLHGIALPAWGTLQPASEEAGHE